MITHQCNQSPDCKPEMEDEESCGWQQRKSWHGGVGGGGRCLKHIWINTYVSGGKEEVPLVKNICYIYQRKIQPKQEREEGTLFFILFSKIDSTSVADNKLVTNHQPPAFFITLRQTNSLLISSWWFQPNTVLTESCPLTSVLTILISTTPVNESSDSSCFS